MMGTTALASLLNPRLLHGQSHSLPRAKRVIFLFMGGGPSQLDMFDHKPNLAKMHGQDLPDSVRKGQRLTSFTSGQKSLPIASSAFKFKQHGERGAWVSELMPHFAKVIDDVTLLPAVFTEAINHDPAMTFLQTGSEQPGRPSLGSWVDYGLGSETEDLPAFLVLHSHWSGTKNPQPIFARLWGSGFLPSRHQGVSMRSQGDPVLYLSNPEGVSPAARRLMLDGVRSMNQQHFADVADPEITARIAQYEMAFRMQTSVPELMDTSSESKTARKLYGPAVDSPGSFAANCLLARRMAERGVRFIQIFHRGWDHHGQIAKDLPLQCGDIDQASAGLIQDLKQRGMLEDTLVVWGGEFGRTTYSQGKLTATSGRDHHPRCFTMWMAGGGIKRGFTFGETDPFCYNIVRDGVHVHDLNATILHCLGINHERLTYRYQGRDFRLTDVHGRVVHEILS